MPCGVRSCGTEPAVRGSGAGTALVVDGLSRLIALGSDLVWCDARVSAAGFYERTGCAAVTEPYDKPGVGSHVGMLEDLRPADGPRSD